MLIAVHHSLAYLKFMQDDVISLYDRIKIQQNPQVIILIKKAVKPRMISSRTRDFTHNSSIIRR